MPFLEFHATNPLRFFGPSFAQNLYILSLIIIITTLFILAALFIVRYLKKFYGARPIPQEWMIFWWAFVFYALHEVVEFVGLYQWVLGKVFFVVYAFIEITAVVLLTWGCYLLLKKYGLEK